VTARSALSAGERPEVLLQEPVPEPHDEGLGLRLLIAGAIAEAHGGTLEIDGEGEDRGDLVLRCALPLPPA
jgi:signal transduction histidine kinase